MLMYSIKKNRNHLLVEYLSVKKMELLFYLYFQSLNLFSRPSYPIAD